MEELLSTDNIHREILDDAKRKAAKILKNAENTIAAASSKWDAKLRKAADEVKARYDAELAEKRTEAKARLAMDKARARLSKITGELEKATRGFCRTLPRKEALAVLERALSVRRSAVKAAHVVHDGASEAVAVSPFFSIQVETYGLARAEAETILGRLSLTAVHIDERKAEDDGLSVINELPAIILTLSGGDIKITASIQAEADAMLLSKRAEAAEALFGEHFG
jgi:DNA repair exonuclease SbcCD ATPase subunit